jgi:hypothetical protein
VKGIFFKYDISSIKIKVKQTHKSYMEFLIRLIGIIGGIYATSLMFNSSFEAVKEFLCANMCSAGAAKTARTSTTQTSGPTPQSIKNPLLEVGESFSIPILQNTGVSK